MTYEHLPYRSKAWIRTERLVNYFWFLHKEKTECEAEWSKLGLCIVKNTTTLFHSSTVGNIIHNIPFGTALHCDRDPNTAVQRMADFKSVTRINRSKSSGKPTPHRLVYPER